MASVLDWLPQSAGPLRVWAGWPGSNGSTMAANGGAVVACADGELEAEADAVPELVLAPLDDEAELLQPAAETARAAAATARYRLCIRSS
jgi:hypothetical protein